MFELSLEVWSARAGGPVARVGRGVAGGVLLARGVGAGGVGGALHRVVVVAGAAVRGEAVDLHRGNPPSAVADTPYWLGRGCFNILVSVCRCGDSFVTPCYFGRQDFFKKSC